MKVRLFFITLLLVVSSLFLVPCFGQSLGKEYATKENFQRAKGVWIDSRNVLDETTQKYSLTDSGHHVSRQTEKNLTVSFRKIIDIDNVDDVQIRLAASNVYRLHVNGNFVGHGPCVAAHDYYRVDEYNLSKYLKRGENIIAIEVASYNEYKYYLLNQLGFLQAEITKGKDVIAYTDARGDDNLLFEGTMLDQRVKDVPSYSFQRPHIESYVLDANYNQWMTIKDDHKFAALKLEETSIKNLISRRVKYPDYTIRKNIGQLPNGLYQFECNSTGFVGVEVEVEEKARIVLSWEEILTEEGDINPRRMGTNNYIYYDLEPGNYSLESFEPYTLQYLRVSIENGSGKVKEPYIRQYVNSDVDRATFNTSNSDLNKIFKAAVETYKQNALDIFMDCPQRERAGWLCDSYFMGRVELNLTGRSLVETNFLENYALPEKFEFLPKGMIPMCYPADHPNANYIPNWAMWYVLELQEYFNRSNDQLMITSSHDKVMGLVEFFEQYENEDMLLEDLDKWIFVEWSEANNFVNGVNYPTNMLYARMLEVVAALYNKPALKYKAEQIKDTIRKQAYNGTFFVDNALRVDGKLVPQKQNCTETCQYYAFYLGVADKYIYPKLWNILINDFGPQRASLKLYEDIYPSNAFIGKYLRLEVLSQNGLVKQLLNESVDNFLYMANRTGTLWENVNTQASVNHGFASHIAHVFYRDLLGIKNIDQLSKNIILEFNDADISFCEGTMPLHDELISVKWKKRGSTLSYSYSVPKGYQVYVKNNTKLNLKQVK